MVGNERVELRAGTGNNFIDAIAVNVIVHGYIERSCSGSVRHVQRFADLHGRLALVQRVKVDAIHAVEE